MPHIKNALIRYRIIDRMLRNKYKSYPSKEELRTACEEALFGSEDGAHICASTIEKDLFNMKMEQSCSWKMQPPLEKKSILYQKELSLMQEQNRIMVLEQH